MNGFVKLGGAAFGEEGAFAQVWSPIADISISSPQFEHLIVGRKLVGRPPWAASVAASDIAAPPFYTDSDEVDVKLFTISRS